MEIVNLAFTVVYVCVCVSVFRRGVSSCCVADARDYSGIIHQARHYASKVLLQHVMQKNQLMDHLVSLKRYFLLHEGDFLVHFLDLAGDELRKPAEDVTLTRLQSLLDLSVRSSIASSDDFKVLPALVCHTCALCVPSRRLAAVLLRAPVVVVAVVALRGRRTTLWWCCNAWHCCRSWRPPASRVPVFVPCPSRFPTMP